MEFARSDGLEVVQVDVGALALTSPHWRVWRTTLEHKRVSCRPLFTILTEPYLRGLDSIYLAVAKPLIVLSLLKGASPCSARLVYVLELVQSGIIFVSCEYLSRIPSAFLAYSTLL